MIRTVRRVRREAIPLRAVDRPPAVRAGPIPVPPIPRRSTIIQRPSRLRRRRRPARRRPIPALPAPPRATTIRTSPLLHPPPHRRTHPPPHRRTHPPPHRRTHPPPHRRTHP